MNIWVVYTVTSLVNMFQILLILNRVKATEYKETIDEPLCRMLKFFALFCVIDGLWGVFDSQLFVRSQFGFTMVAYGYHTMAALSAFIWFGYAMHFMKISGTDKEILNGLRFLLLAVQAVTLGSNLFTHTAFYIDENCHYSSGNFRIVLYTLQFLYYIILLIYGTLRWKNSSENKDTYREVVIFSLIPLVFGIGQYAHYDISMYGFGFSFTALAIYSFNTTVQRELFLKEKASKLREDVYKDALTGLYNRNAYEEDIKNASEHSDKKDQVYISMDLNGLKEINDNRGHDAGDEFLRSAAFCMKTCLGGHGKVYRIGGDEFVAIISADSQKIREIEQDFENVVQSWNIVSGQSLSISYGYATGEEFPNLSLSEMAKIADKRMYSSKARFYADKGVDRRMQARSGEEFSKENKMVSDRRE